MNIAKTSIAIALGGLFIASASAQTTGTTVQRDVNQQNRIEQGLQSGSLSTGEAARLEGQETKVEKMQAKDLQDGKLSPAEKARLDKAQDKVSTDIHRDKNNAVTGNPNSASSKRMQTDVQRNANQQARIEQGVQSGQLTNHQTGKLERGQSHVTHKEAQAGANGHVGAREQANIQAREDHQSGKIYVKKHDETTRP
jgi:hypothetical protein